MDYPDLHKKLGSRSCSGSVGGTILKGQNYAKNRLPKFATRHTAQTGKFRKPNA